MAKLPLDLSKFKKVASDKGATVLKHADGHEIKLAHHALSPKMRGQLSALPTMKEAGEVEGKNTKVKMMADGANPGSAPSIDDVLSGANSSKMLDVEPVDPIEGMVNPPNASSMDEMQQQQAMPPQAPMPQQAAPQAQGVAVPGDGLPQAQAAPQGPAPFIGPPTEPVPQELPPQQPTAENAYVNADKANRMVSKSEQEQAKDSLDAAQRYQNNATQIQNRFTASYNHMDGEFKNFVQAIKDQHIDPNHFMGSMDTDQKIGVAIGLIAGGMGGAHAQGNPALDYINKQIANDIEAQKLEMGKKENLLTATMHQFGNMRDATTMATAMLQAKYANDIQMAALKQGNPMAQARLLKNSSDLQNAYAPAMQQMALTHMLMGSSGGPQDQALYDQDPEKIVNLMNLPPAQHEAVIKEISQARGMVKAKDNILSAFEQLANINTVGNRLLSPLQTSEQVASIRDHLVAGLSKETAGRFTEQDAEYLKSLFPSSGNNEQTIAIKRDQLNRLLAEKMNFSQMIGLHMDPNKFRATSSAPAAMKQDPALPGLLAKVKRVQSVDPNHPVVSAFFEKHPELRGR